MGFYIPPLAFDIAHLITKRIEEIPELSDTLKSVAKTTGQKFIRITRDWQDPVCIATQAVFAMTEQIDSALNTLRYLVSATETPVDASKPISAFIMGILQKAGLDIPHDLMTYQTQHACAGGTISIMQVAAMINNSYKPASAIVTTCDIARYEKNTTAEITQGSGSVALHISKNPRFMTLDVTKAGQFSSDVDDFFRPLHSLTARVRGQFSVRCYTIAIEAALQDLAAQHGQSMEEILQESDYIVLHTPFYSMPKIGLRYLLKTKLKYSKEDYEKFVEQKYIHDTAEAIGYIGNTYTASTFFCLGAVMEKHLREKKDINNKKVLILSYGSGNTSVALKGQTTKNASQIVSTWNLLDQIESSQQASFEQYDSWLKNEIRPTQDVSNISSDDTQKNTVYISKIREDDYRVYDILSSKLT